EKAQAMSAEQRLLLLDTWQRSDLPAEDFAGLVGISKHTLYAWKKRFDAEGPAGLMDRPRGGTNWVAADSSVFQPEECRHGLLVARLRWYSQVVAHKDSSRPTAPRRVTQRLRTPLGQWSNPKS